MNKYATFLAVVTLTTGFVALRTGSDSAPEKEPASVQETIAHTEEVQELITSYRAFKRTLEATIELLRRQEIGLKEARTQVRESAQRYYPKYLNWLKLCETGTTVDHRLAQNLVGHVRTIEQYHPSNPSPVSGLEQQLRDLLTEPAE